MQYRSLLLAAVSAVSLHSTGALAQAPAAESEVEQLVVTGSRVARSRLDTLAPVDVVDNKALTQQATPELAQALANLAPSLDFPRPAITDGTDSVRPATLRGLSPDQTLVLINGVRHHASALVNVNGSIGRGAAAVDLNTIPAVALDRVEILRDGASAQYGSDAIAGVINLQLRQAREGGGASVSYGVYNTEVKTARIPDGRKAHDGNTYSISGWQGLPLGAEGFLTLSGEYVYRNPTNRSDRDPRAAAGGKVTGRYGDPQVESKTIYANAGVPVNEAWGLYGWASYQNRKGDSAANPRLADNANNVPSLFPSGFLPLITTDIDDYTLAAGAKGEWSGFNIDANVSLGGNKVNYGVANSVNGSLGAASPTRFDAGSMKYDQLVIGLDVTRPLEIGGFTSTNLAFGAEYRDESYAIGAGDVASYTFGGLAGKAAGAQGFPGFKPSNEVDVSRHAWSLYVDVETQVNDKFNIDLAGRYEDYSDFGSTATGKIAARYDFTDSFALRGAIASGFRAPSLQQQFFTATSTNFISIGGVSTPVEVGTFPSVSPVARALGGQPLDAETSMNYSAGVVFRSGAFELTIDAYRIDIDDRIVLSENIQGSPTGSATAVAIYQLINPPGTGGGLGAARFFINGVETQTTGLDAVARYRITTEGAGRFDLMAAANFNDTEVTKIPTTAPLSALPVPPILFDRGNRLTFEQGTPDKKFVASVDWTLGDLSATAKATYYGDVLTPNNNAALDYWTGKNTVVDVEARYQLPWNTTAAVGVNNLFDEYPTATPTNVNTNGPIGFPSYSPFGFNGQFLYTRLSVSW
ncbi:TonB-dependent receptor [Caulobacter sp. 73W]|uniref:TonB-dependent receptor n=1 Tax=Caulobacter sp. 73W TaxID=3161137 RepID=A0AB39KT69_9CAUL